MRIFRGAYPFEFGDVGGDDRALVAAIGNFDGVHRGHRALLAEARAASADLGAVRIGVLTFEPHPRDVFQPDDDPFRLTLEPLKLRRLDASGVDDVFILPFDRAFARIDAETFAADAVGRALRPARVLVGADFRFGARRAGDVEMLRRVGAENAFDVRSIEKVGDVEPFSSSAIRADLKAGRVEAAARMLGDWHRIEGVVSQGDQRGRDLGYPTANLALGREIQPRYGVYAVCVEVRGGPHAGRYDGVASLGVRPTFGVNAANFETHLFDFEGDLYGAEISVELRRFLRPEAAFEGVEPLIAAMNADAADARAALADSRPPWSP